MFGELNGKEIANVEFDLFKESLDTNNPPQNLSTNSAQAIGDYTKNKKNTFKDVIDVMVSDNYDSNFAFGKSMDYKPEKFSWTTKNYNVGELYEELSDGSLYKKFDTYTPGINNYEDHAQKMTFGDKAWNGIVKGLDTVITGVGGGTVGTIYGIGEAIAEGRFASLYDNDFTKELDLHGEKMKLDYAHYKTIDEQDDTFFEQFGNANYWFDDLTQGFAFTTGALATEAIWAWATGGTSLTTVGARWGMKGVNALGKLSKVASTVGKVADKALDTTKYLDDMTRVANAGRKAVVAPQVMATTNTLSKLNQAAYTSGIWGGRIGEGANVLRGMVTSAGYEAGFEARAFMNESRKDYMSTFESQNGRKPTKDEIAEFEASLDSSANGLFAYNTAIVGMSNVAQFGNIMKIRLPKMPFADTLNKKIFGVGLETVEGVGVKALKATKLQKGMQIGYSLGKGAIVEGAWEEGMQSVGTHTAETLMKASYDKNLAKENYGVAKAFGESLGKTYGTKEGLNEVFTGMVVGALTGNVMGMVQTAKAGSFTVNHEFANANKRNKQIEETFSGDSRYSSKNAIENMVMANRVLQSKKAEENADKKGDFLGGELARSTSLFANFSKANNLDYLDDHIEQLSSQVDLLSEKDLAEKQGITVSQARELKDSMKEELVDQAKSFKRINEFSKYMIGNKISSAELEVAVKKAQEINPGIDEKLVKNQIVGQLREALTYELYMGETSYKHGENMLGAFQNEVENLFGDSEIKGALNIVDVLNKSSNVTQRELFKAKIDLKTTKEELTKLDKEQRVLETVVANARTPEARQEAVSKLNELVTRREDLANKEQELTDNWNILFDSAKIENPYNKSKKQILSSDEILNAEKTVNTTLGSIDQLPQDKAIRLKTLLREYEKSISATKKYSDRTNQMMGLGGDLRADKGIIGKILASKTPRQSTIEMIQGLLDTHYEQTEVENDAFENSIQEVKLKQPVSEGVDIKEGLISEDTQIKIDELEKQREKELKEATLLDDITKRIESKNEVDTKELRKELEDLMSGKSSDKSFISLIVDTLITNYKNRKSQRNEPIKQAVLDIFESYRTKDLTVQDYSNILEQFYQNIRSASYDKSNVESDIDNYTIRENSLIEEVRNQSGWHYRIPFGAKLGSSKNRFSLNVKGDKNLIDILDKICEEYGIYYKTPDSSDNWLERHDPISIYVTNKNLTDAQIKELKERIVLETKPFIRSNEGFGLYGENLSEGVEYGEEATPENADELVSIGSGIDIKIGEGIKSYLTSANGSFKGSVGQQMAVKDFFNLINTLTPNQSNNSEKIKEIQDKISEIEAKNYADIVNSKQAEVNNINNRYDNLIKNIKSGINKLNLVDYIKEQIKNNPYIFENVGEDFSQSLPKEGELDEYLAFYEKNELEEIPLTDEEKQRYNELNDKFANWQLMEAMEFEGVSLADLIKQQASLNQEPTVVEDTILTEDDLETMEESVNEEVSQQRRFEVLQTPQNVFVQVKDGEVMISHLTLQSLIGFAGKTEVEVSRGDSSEKVAIEDINDYVELNDIISFDNINVKYIKGGKIVMYEDDFQSLNLPIRATKSGYSLVYGNDGKPMKSDFADVDTYSPSEISKLSSGDELTMVVDLEDSYNSRLLGKSEQEIFDNLKISLEDNDGNKVADLKANYQAEGFDIDEKFLEIRKKAVEMVKESIDTRITIGYVPVSTVFLGAPGVEIDPLTKQIQEKEIIPELVQDYGYWDGQKLVLKGGTKARVDFLKGVKKQLPIVVLKEGNNLIAYPVSLNTVDKMLGQEIMDRNLPKAQLATELNKQLKANGIDSNLFFIASDNTNMFEADGKTSQDLETAIEALNKVQDKPDYTKTWFENSHSKDKLKAEASINVDMNSGQMFLSPKIVVSLNDWTEVANTTERLSEKAVELIDLKNQALSLGNKDALLLSENTLKFGGATFKFIVLDGELFTQPIANSKWIDGYLNASQEDEQSYFKDKVKTMTTNRGSNFLDRYGEVYSRIAELESDPFIKDEYDSWANMSPEKQQEAYENSKC